MLEKKTYANGQAVYAMEGERLTYYYKNGKVKAEGIFRDELMEGEWVFYRENGQLWQVGHFAGGKKDGSWVRYGKDGGVEYEESFVGDKLVKK